MTARRTRRLRLTALMLLTLPATLARGSAAAQGEPSPPKQPAASQPWALLSEARRRMADDGPQVWTFRQSYLPSGFDRGEEENGRVALDLPRCVRWDYAEPYPKSFLLCGDRLWSWNPGEPVGHVYDLDATQPGLDLLLLAVDDLEQRYTAQAQRAGNATRVHLTPKRTGGDALRDAAILVGGDGGVRELTYRDAEGNRSTFRFTTTKALPGRGHFTAPEGVKWERDAGAGAP
jgi:outer membrane lipoprotein-sorting protein